MDLKDELLLREIDHAQTTLLANEELGDRRVNTLLTIAGAAGLAFGLIVDANTLEGAELLLAGASAFGAVAVVGLITLRRVMQRNLLTTDLINALGRIRASRLATDPDLIELFPFLPSHQEMVRKRRKILTIGKGGHLEMVGLITSLTAGAAVGAAVTALTGYTWSWLVAAPAAVGMWAVQMRWARRVYADQAKKMSVERQEAEAHWRRSGQMEVGGSPSPATYFRAGVGIVVTRADGRVLTFARTDTDDGSRQLPQGGIEPGESAIDAAFRELAEETGLGTNDVELVSVSPFHTAYELPEEYRSAKTGRGQVHRWVHVEVRRADLPPVPTDSGAELTDPAWLEPNEVVEAAVEFRRPAYRAVADWLIDAMRPPEAT